MAKNQVVYASAARTATPTAVTIQTGRYKYLDLVFDVTAAAATPSVVCTVDGYDPISGKYYNLLTSAAFDQTVAVRTLRIGPGLIAASNLTIGYALPGVIRVTMTHGDADSITYSVAATLMVG